jgi:hypothetical protein
MLVLIYNLTFYSELLNRTNVYTVDNQYKNPTSAFFDSKMVLLLFEALKWNTFVMIQIGLG